MSFYRPVYADAYQQELVRGYCYQSSERSSTDRAETPSQKKQIHRPYGDSATEIADPQTTRRLRHRSNRSTDRAETPPQK